MNILSITMGADTGGTSIALKRAFDDVDGWELRSLVATVNFIAYETDLPWSEPNIREWWTWADVIHTHHRPAVMAMLTGGWHGFRLPQRGYVVTFHGGDFRKAPRTCLRDIKPWGAIPLVSTLDLWLLAPDEVTWLPCPINVNTMQSLRIPVDDETIRIAHAPTNRDIKSTGEFQRAIHRLQKAGYPVEAILIEHQPWAECLRQKAKADVYFDQVKLGYGNNAIEAWGMGIPVVAGGADPTLDEMERRFGSLPFYHATEETIYDALREMVESPELRQKMADRGLAHVRQFHDERVVVEQLKDIYLRAAGERGERAA